MMKDGYDFDEGPCLARDLAIKATEAISKIDNIKNWQQVRQVIFDVLVDANVNILGEEGWTIAVVKCEICDHTWKAMYHSWVDELVCPHCNQKGDFELINLILTT